MKKISIHEIVVIVFVAMVLTGIFIKTVFL